jgi:hypothetical protein
MPSAYDLRRNEQLAIERQQERERLKAWAISRFGQKAQSWPSTSRLDEYLKPTPEGSDG